VDNNTNGTHCSISYQQLLRERSAILHCTCPANLAFDQTQFSFNQFHKDHPQNRPRRLRGAVDVYIYSFFNPGAGCGWVVNATPRPLYPRKRTGTYCIGGWVGPRSGTDGRGKSRPPTGFDPGIPASERPPTDDVDRVSIEIGDKMIVYMRPFVYVVLRAGVAQSV
jgi:hypothetical protein